MSAVGPTLFHYTNPHALVGIIRNREIWATESNYLNDPTEVSFATSVLIQTLRGRTSDGQKDKSARIDMAVALLERAYREPNSPDQYREDRSFIASFSRTDSSLTLWRAYAGANGFSIGFDEHRLLEWVGLNEFPAYEPTPNVGREETERIEALRANYQIEGRVKDVLYGEAHVEPIAELIIAPPAGTTLLQEESDLRGIFRQLSEIKHEAYADERESRLILQELGHHALDPEVRVTAVGKLAAYRKIVFPFEAVTSITTAPGADFPQTKRAISSLLARGGRAPWGHVEVRPSEIPFVW